MHWKRLNYLLHRWTAIVLGAIVFVWFVSGIAMMYYPYPELTERERVRALAPLRLNGARVIDFEEARRGAGPAWRGNAGRPTARLVRWGDRLVYALYAQRGSRRVSVALVDAADGTVLSPITAEQAVQVARPYGGRGSRATTVDLLPRSDRYFMGNEVTGTFPVYRVRFDDEASTAVYVAVRTGEAVAVVDRLARLTTWIGTVPHWLYFEKLYYEHFDAWLWLNILLPFAAMAIALTGMVLGFLQLLPRRSRREWRVSGYHGVSKWHHVAGVVFGAIVFTWTLSGMLEVLGPSFSPGARLVDEARGDTSSWQHTTLDVTRAMERVAATSLGDDIVAVDFERSGGHAGYLTHLRSGTRVWIDAITGAVRRQIDSMTAIEAGSRLARLPPNVAAADLRLTADAFYYATHERDLVLPVWRVRFRDAAHTAVYLDPVTALPTGRVDDSVRRWRWWRDALHDFDFPALVDRRPLWDLVVLALMLGGMVSCTTGVWLLMRRLWRLRPGV